MSETIYRPTRSQIDQILKTSRFERIHDEITEAHPNETVFSTATYAFAKYMGWTGGLFGFGERTYDERFVLIHNLGIPQKNAISYAANTFAGQPEEAFSQELGPDLFTETIPELASAGYDGFLLGFERIEKAFKIAAVVAAVGVGVYLISKTGQVAKTAKA